MNVIFVSYSAGKLSFAGICVNLQRARVVALECILYF